MFYLKNLKDQKALSHKEGREREGKIEREEKHRGLHEEGTAAKEGFLSPGPLPSQTAQITK